MSTELTYLVFVCLKMSECWLWSWSPIDEGPGKPIWRSWTTGELNHGVLGSWTRRTIFLNKMGFRALKFVDCITSKDITYVKLVLYPEAKLRKCWTKSVVHFINIRWENAYIWQFLQDMPVLPRRGQAAIINIGEETVTLFHFVAREKQK